MYKRQALQSIKSERAAGFAKALRRRLKVWLCQLTLNVRAEIRRAGLPVELVLANGAPCMHEDFADNAFVYASVQVMRCGLRDGAWHTDGGASLLHAGLTPGGHRVVEVEADGGCISLPQRPGSFYVGNCCALKHRVVHHPGAAGCMGERSPEDQVKVAVLFRSDVFRRARARAIDSTPGPAELFDLASSVSARQLAAEPFVRPPDLAEVMAETV